MMEFEHTPGWSWKGPPGGSDGEFAALTRPARSGLELSNPTETDDEQHKTRQNNQPMDKSLEA
jgi:hypothetical protein